MSTMTSYTSLSILVLVLLILAIAYLAISGALTVTNKAKKTESSLQQMEIATASVATTAVTLYLADNDNLRAQGLSGIESLPKNSGMLFVFDEEKQPSFWMKDMHFPIDIVWIDSEHKVVGIEDTISPDSYPQSFSPKKKAQYVLEVPAGFSKQHALQVGDTIDLTNIK